MQAPTTDFSIHLHGTEDSAAEDSGASFAFPRFGPLVTKWLSCAGKGLDFALGY